MTASLQREPVALKRAGDPRERHAEGAERHDLVQPADVSLGVVPVAGSVRSEADLVVMMQRANGEPGALRELADPQSVVSCDCCMVGTIRPDVTSGSTTRGIEADVIVAAGPRVQTFTTTPMLIDMAPTILAALDAPAGIKHTGSVLTSVVGDETSVKADSVAGTVEVVDEEPTVSDTEATRWRSTSGVWATSNSRSQV